jgi:hypothetical protein
LKKKELNTYYFSGNMRQRNAIVICQASWGILQPKNWQEQVFKQVAMPSWSSSFSFFF